MDQGDALALSPRHINLIVFFILGLYPLVGMGVDLLAPSLPAISRDMQISSTISKNMISIYLFGYAVGNFLIGFLSDTLGRRKIIITSFLIFSVTSILPTLFPTSFMLLTVRFVQGLSIAAYAVVARAVFSDILSEERLKQTATLLATMWGIGPVIGPVIGGYLQYYFGWQACFYFFAAFSSIGFIAMLVIMPETHHSFQPLNYKLIKNNFTTMLKDRVFIGVAIFMGTAYATLIVFNTLGPFLIQTVFGHTPLFFGRIALCMGLTFLVGTFLSRRLIKRFQPEEIWLKVLPLLLTVTVSGVVFCYVWHTNIWVISMLSLLIFFGAGIIYPTAMAKGLTLFRHVAGSSSAMINLINILITSCVGMLMSFVNLTTVIPLAWIYLTLIILNGLSFWCLILKPSVKVLNPHTSA